MLNVQDMFYQFCRKKLGDGHNTTFWEDTWVDDKPLKIAYPRLYLLCFDHNIALVDALQKGWKGLHLEEHFMGKLWMEM